MNKPRLKTGIRRAWDYATRLDIAESFANGEPFSPSDEFRDISLNFGASYEEIYLEGLSNVQYNIILTDLSYMQFGRDADSEYRFAYYPNPFLGSSHDSLAELGEISAYVSEGVISTEEYLHRIAEVRYSGHPPFTRYENSASQYVELCHPCSHFHLGHHGDNRWPLKRSLSAEAFALIVFRHYYSDRWLGARASLLDSEMNPFDVEMETARAACPPLADNLFSTREERLFHFF